MSEENTQTPEAASTPEIQNSTPPDNGEKMSNPDVKTHPLFLKMTSQVAELNKKIEERDAADKESKTKADQSKLLEEKNFTELLASKESEFKAKLTTLEQQLTEKDQQITKKDLKIALTGKGFANETFLNGAVAGYDLETHGDFAKYAETLAADEANAAFLNSMQTPRKGRPNANVPNPPTVTLTPAELNAQLKSDDPKKRAEARKIAMTNWETKGSTGV